MKKYFMNPGVYISLGIAQITDPVKNYTMKLNDKTNSAEDIYLPQGSALNSGLTPPQYFNYRISNRNTVASAGVTLNSSKHKKTYHLIEASYMQLSGEYSYATDYSEAYGTLFSHIYDTAQAAFMQKAISVCYKFQPTFKYIFCSLGISLSVNLLEVEEQKNREVDRNNEFGQLPTLYSNISATRNLYFFTVPIQIGAGGYVRLKKMVIKPGVYFAPLFTHGYNASLDFLYVFK